MLFILNGTILTMACDIIRHGNILIEQGKIKAVGSDVTLPHHYKGKIIDAKENFVMPGIIESHCHIGITEEKKGMEGEDCNENGNTITPHLRAIDSINPMDAAFDDAVRAGITFAMIGPGSTNVVERKSVV